MHPLRLARGRGDLIIRRHSGRSGCVRFPAIMTHARDARCGVPHARDARRGGAHAQVWAAARGSVPLGVCRERLAGPCGGRAPVRGHRGAAR